MPQEGNGKEGRGKEKKKGTQVEKQRLAIKTIAIVGEAIVPIMLLIGVVVGLPWLLVTSLMLGALVFYLSGVKIPQAPERWIVERLGRFKRNLKPGWNWTIPILDTVRKKPRILRHAISMFLPEKKNESPIVDFVDGSVPVLNPVLYAIPDRDHPERLIYEVDDWVYWIRDNVEPHLLGYLRTLKIQEGLDEGMARGNLFDRIKQASEITRGKLEAAQGKIRELKAEIERSAERKGVLGPLIDEFENSAERLSELVPTHEKINQELERVLKQAEQIGVAEIPGAFIGDFVLSAEIKKARQEPLIAKRQAEAAYFQAVRESELRAEPVFQTTAKLREAGLSKKKAIDAALSLERLETLAEKSIWTAGLAEVVAPLLEKVAPSIVEAFLARVNRPNQQA